jgi:transposase-like protein
MAAAGKVEALFQGRQGEQDHRRIKRRIRPMLGFKRFDRAAVTISAIKLVQKIQKHQFKISTLGGRSATMPELWNAVLAA